MPEISVVAPVYNQAAATLAELVRRLTISIASITDDFEIILVDDGSKNDAWIAIRQLAQGEPRVRGFRLARNFGQHFAITAGIDQAMGNWVIVMDADLQDRPEVVPSLYAQAKKGYDVVFVNRVERPESLAYRFVTACFYGALNVLSGESYDRAQGNYSILSRDVVRAFRSLRESGRFYSGIVRWVGFRQGSIDAQHGDPAGGTTSYSMIKRIRWALNIIVGFSSRLLYIAIGVGLLMAAVSFVMAAVIAFEKLRSPEIPLPGWPSVMTALFFTAGVTNVAIGLTGMYIGQILQQTKGRPLYIIATDTERRGESD